MKIQNMFILILPTLILAAGISDSPAQERLSVTERQKKMKEAEDFFRKKKAEYAENKAKEDALKPEREAKRRTLASAGNTSVASETKRAEAKKAEEARLKALRENIKTNATQAGRAGLAKKASLPPVAKPVPAPTGAASGAPTAQLNKKPGPPAKGPVDAGGVPVPSKRIIPNLTSGDAGKRKKDEVVITAKGGALFNDADKLVVFEEEVHVDHPDFIIDCGLLELWLEEGALEEGKKKEAEKGKKVEVKPAAVAPVAGAAGNVAGAAKKDEKSAIRKAIASKGTVTIQKRRADGKLDVGRSRRLLFDGKTKDITLSGSPQVQTGNKQIIATAEHTVIYLKGNGKNPEVVGPHKTVILSNKTNLK